VNTLGGSSLLRDRSEFFVTDGGIETDLIYRRGVELADFAAFPLLETAEGRAVLQRYFDGYLEIAKASRCGLMLESPTWRANPDWGERLGYSAQHLARINESAIAMMIDIRRRHLDSVPDIIVSGSVGPRYDAYSADKLLEPDTAMGYHLPQLRAFATAGADLATAYTLTHVGEAVGVVRAARTVGLPVAISFTVETDGRLPNGVTLARAIMEVDAAAAPDYFLVNCAHPSHIERAVSEPGHWTHRIAGLRGNASTASHAELDGAIELDDGNPEEFAAAQQNLTAHFPHLSIFGGCCGTDARHIAALARRRKAQASRM
jgi:S-methylmethionine-dependent homocysteine/selenocysteine methylase